MKVNVVRIGNSRGIRIPKTVLEQCHLKDAVELEVEDNRLVVRTAARPRQGWEDAFRRMHQHRDDKLRDQKRVAPTQWDRTEWHW